MTTRRIEKPGRTEVTVTLAKGETHWCPGSTKKEFVGPGIVRYDDDATGYTTLLVDLCTARVRYKDKS